MKFKKVVEAFSQIEKNKSRNDIIKMLADLFDDATPQQAQMLTYLSLGQVRAPYLGNHFNIAEKTIKKVLKERMQMSDTVFDALMQERGDVGTFFSEHADDCAGNDLTVEEVFTYVVELQAISGEGAQDTRGQFLEHIMQQLTPLEGGFLLRIILGKLRTGFSDMTLIDAFSWMLVGTKSLHKEIEAAYSICADLGLIAYTLKKEGIIGLAQIHITPGIPLLPALAERLPTVHDIMEKMGPCVAQPKLDGFRLQIHVRQGAHPGIWFYSRNLMPMTDMFPELTQAVQKLEVQDAVFEGEAIVFDESTGAFLPFQQTVKRKRKHDIAHVAQEFPLKLFVFDLLYLNGESMLDKGHEFRRSKARAFLSSDHTATVSLIDEHRIATEQELEDYFLSCIEEGLEGLVVKKMHAHYQPGKRNFNWIKLKRTTESGNLSDTIDAVVLGYYKGRGRRAALGIGAFLIGVYDTRNDRYETIAKVGTGLSDEAFIQLKKACDEQRIAQPAHNVVCAKELYPDIWVQPALVWVVGADEITRSPLHTAGKTAHELGYALRFPRALHYRTDKSAEQVTTVDEIKHMFNNSYLKKAELKRRA